MKIYTQHIKNFTENEIITYKRAVISKIVIKKKFYCIKVCYLIADVSVKLIFKLKDNVTVVILQ